MSRYGPVTALILLLQMAHANAASEDAPFLDFSAYGSAGVVYSNEERADFVSTTLAPEGAGATGDWSFEPDSRLGLQFIADLTSKLSATVQFVTEQRYDDTWTPTLEWANLKYQATPDIYLRVGRIVLPGLMASEYRKVGYALPWIRPPLEVYGIQPVSNSDGLDAGYEFRLGSFTNTVRFNYGRKDVKSPNGSESQARDIWGLTGTAETGPLTLHLGYQTADVTVPATQPLFDGFRQFGPPGQAIADRFDFDGKSLKMIGLGARYDPGAWFATGEWTRFESRTFVGDRYGWYVTAGRRFNTLTPYLTVAGVESSSATSDPGLNVAGLPPPLAVPAQALNAALNDLLGSAPQQKSLALGLRWDFTRNFALKVQYDHIDMDKGSSGFLTNEQPDFAPGGSVSVFSATIDFVY